MSICHGNGVQPTATQITGGRDPGSWAPNASACLRGGGGNRRRRRVLRGDQPVRVGPRSHRLRFWTKSGPGVGTDAAETLVPGAPTKCVCEEGGGTPVRPAVFAVRRRRGGVRHRLRRAGVRVPQGERGGWPAVLPAVRLSRVVLFRDELHRRLPGTNAVCECDDPNARTGVTPAAVPGDVSTTWGTAMHAHAGGVHVRRHHRGMRALASFREYLEYVGQVCDLPVPARRRTRRGRGRSRASAAARAASASTETRRARARTATPASSATRRGTCAATAF